MSDKEKNSCNLIMQGREVLTSEIALSSKVAVRLVGARVNHRVSTTGAINRSVLLLLFFTSADGLYGTDITKHKVQTCACYSDR